MRVADQRFDRRRQRIDDEARQDSGDQAKRGEDEHRGEREAIGLVRALSRRRARPAEEGHAERLHEAGGGQRSRQRQQRADRRHQQFQAPRGQLRAQQDRLERQPLGDKAVERRQRRNGDTADQEREARSEACGG